MHHLALIITTLSLGSMAGISGSHYFQVKQVVAHHELEAEQIALLDLKLAREAAMVDQPAAPTELELAVQAASHAVELQQEHNEALLEILTEMRDEQDSMQRQLAETNSDLDKAELDLTKMSRDLADANFRLDTHSDSFKPLDIVSDNPRRLNFSDSEVHVNLQSGSGLLPPIDR